jgi:hypothetical protein
MKLYHGTSSSNIQSILDRGLLASRPTDVNYEIFEERAGDHPGVSLTPRMGAAFQYGDIVIEVNLDLDDFDTTEIPMFDEILVNDQDVPAEFIRTAWKDNGRTWIPRQEFDDRKYTLASDRVDYVDTEDGEEEWIHVWEIEEVR